MSGIHQMMLGSGASFIFNDVVAADMYDYNIRTRAVAAGWNGIDPLTANITVNAGVYIGQNAASYAFDTDAGFPTGSTLAAIINGYILGKGGVGAGGYSDGGNGSAGGTAIKARFPILMTNNGVLGGGGGGGGEGSYGGGGGGGGQGYVGGPAGSAGTDPGAGNGTNGTRTAAGGGGVGGQDSGDGGSGGALGQPGQDGLFGGYGAPGLGGAAGKCVEGNSNVTWLATGTRYGALV